MDKIINTLAPDEKSSLKNTLDLYRSKIDIPDKQARGIRVLLGRLPRHSGLCEHQTIREM